MNTPYFTAGLSRRPDAELGLFYDPRLFQGVLFRGAGKASANWAVRYGIWRDGENLYYKFESIGSDHNVMIFTANNGKYYENLVGEMQEIS